ncbi:MAG: hypothetical protein KF866_02940 [Phycisphaeraceae bacterium]|nr:hypothetical protein [Phycisphaeraceae bacterium]MCW5753348.1 hypothetical protein [Phycisphaeraceae bacterium]
MSQTIFFDDGLGQLAPLTDLRPAFDIRTGAFTNLERIGVGLQLSLVGLWVPPGLVDLTRDRHDVLVNSVPDLADPILLINGRCPLPLREIDDLAPGERLVEQKSDQTIAARLAPAEARRLLEGEPVGQTVLFDKKVLLSRPWEVRSVRDLAIETDLKILAGMSRRDVPAGVAVVGDHRPMIHPESNVCPGVTLVCEDGPVVIDRRAQVRPGAIIIGPAYVGPGSTVLERATIRSHTAVGPVCKVNGEIAGTVFQGYANKAHDGYLGDSWVGEWVNLGAGTTNSNLLNTYTPVIAQAWPGMSRERTEETFLGAVIGDHVKTAICTRIMTGCVIHLGSMLAGTAPVSGCIAPFSWYTDSGCAFYRLSKFLDVLHTAMGRRDIEPSEAYLARLRELHLRSSPLFEGIAGT